MFDGGFVASLGRKESATTGDTGTTFWVHDQQWRPRCGTSRRCAPSSESSNSEYPNDPSGE